jgi:hypothetical protein
MRGASLPCMAVVAISLAGGGWPASYV